MKHIFLFLLIAGFGILTRAQTQYDVFQDGRDKILKGMISRDLLEKDSAFPWFGQNQSSYTPDAATLTAFRNQDAKLDFIVFIGTWNSETRNLLPKFYSILDAVRFPEDRVTLVGVDRRYQSLNSLYQTMHITRLPTFIVLENGKERGRIEEYGKTGCWEKEIGGIVNAVR